MSILINGIKMPKKGMCIDIVIFDDGTVVCYDDDKQIGEAVELPDHGDLIMLCDSVGIPEERE